MATLGGHDYGGIGGLSGGLKSAGGANGPLGAMHPQSPWAQKMAAWFRQNGRAVPPRAANSAWARQLGPSAARAQAIAPTPVAAPQPITPPDWWRTPFPGAR